MKITERKDIYDLVNADDKVIGHGTYEEAKAQGLFTRSVHIFLCDNKNRLLLCRRAATKASYPNLITSSAGGHVDRGETHENAAYRELKEELGIYTHLFDCGRFDLVNERERTIHHLYTGLLTEKGRKSLSVDQSEIAKIYFKNLLITLNDTRTHPIKYAPPFRQAIELFCRQKTYVVDFDHTIFDWYGFKIALEKVLIRCGTRPGFFSRSKDRQEERDGLYHIYAHLEELESLSKVSYKILEKEFKRLLRVSQRYIFSDAKKFLHQVRKSGSQIILLTHGDMENQNIFIRGTGAIDYFEQVIKVEKKERKTAIIKKIVSNAPGIVIMVNDDPEEALAVAPFLPITVRNYLVERQAGKFKSIKPRKEYIVIKKLTEIF